MLDERTARRLQGQAKAREKVELQARAPPPSVCVLSSQSTRVHSLPPVCVEYTHHCRYVCTLLLIVGVHTPSPVHASRVRWPGMRTHGPGQSPAPRGTRVLTVLLLCLQARNERDLRNAMIKMNTDKASRSR